MRKTETKSTVLLKYHLKALKLPTMLAECGKIAQRCAADNADHLAFLLQLVELELIERERKAAERRLKAARFPTVKLLDEFEFAARPSLNKPLVLELLQGEYLDRRENILLVGPSGTGKTHLATALGMSACAQGRKVRFFRVTELVTLLLEAKEERMLLRLRQQLGKLDLLILGELGYVPASKAGAELLFDVIATAYERYSLIVTTNLPFENWTKVLGSEWFTGAALDRLTHRCHNLKTKGRVTGWRMPNAGDTRHRPEAPGSICTRNTTLRTGDPYSPNAAIFGRPPPPLLTAVNRWFSMKRTTRSVMLDLNAVPQSTRSPMSTHLRTLTVVILGLCPLPLGATEIPSKPLTLESPDTRLRVKFQLDEQGRPVFDVMFRDLKLAMGTLGLEFAGSGPLNKNLKLNGTRRTGRDENYSIPVGKASSARNHHNELFCHLIESSPPHRRLDIVFRAFDEGIAFRYEIPEEEQEESLVAFVLTDELTRFSFPGAPSAHALPLKNYTTPYEAYYETLPVSEVGPQRLLGLPLLLERKVHETERVWMALTEANLTDYAGMYFAGVADEPGTLATKLSPLPGRTDGAKVLGSAPHVSPWRVLMIAEDPGRLIESHLVFHLSDPPAIEDTSWIKPGKTMFPWWNHYVLEGVDFEPGVNTATMKHYIDFCAEQGIPYHSLDGLDIAWYGGPIRPNGPTDVTTSAPSIDLPELLRFAKEKGVRLRLWMHWKALKPQIDEAFALYEKWGIEGVMVDFMDRDDQEMVRFYHEMAEKAAKHHLTLTFHGAYKPTGMERTWPNVLSYEAVLNQEYNKWQPPGVKGTPPEHNLDVAFIRMLAGPLDYHQGGMRNVLPENYQFRDIAPPVQGTRGHQLAMYVVYQNHLPMMADYPEAYRGEPGLTFLVQVPTNWDETRVLHAEFGKCLVIARRKESDWYIGGMTASEERRLELQLEFLGDGAFEAELYLDHPADGPTSVVFRKQNVTAADSLSIVTPRSGGFAVRVTPIIQ